MKRIRVVISILLVGLCVACGNKMETEKSSDESIIMEENFKSSEKEEVKTMQEDENILDEKDHSIMAYKRYDNVDKSKLRYTLFKNDGYYYETVDSFVGNEMLNKIPNIDDKRYKHVLVSYLFTLGLGDNSIVMTYDEAIKRAKSILPDDIKEERVKYNESEGIIRVVYSSSKGNFVVMLTTKVIYENNGKYNHDKEKITGIGYLKEVI